jgi:hypothetical protein
LEDGRSDGVEIFDDGGVWESDHLEVGHLEPERSISVVRRRLAMDASIDFNDECDFGAIKV